MRTTFVLATALFALTSAPVFAAIGNVGSPQAIAFATSQPSPTKIANPCPPGEVPTSSASGAKSGCEIPANPQAGVKNAVPSSANPCPAGETPTGSTSGAKGGCESATRPQAGVTGKIPAGTTPCPPGRAPTGSTSGNNGGCEIIDPAKQ